MQRPPRSGLGRVVATLCRRRCFFSRVLMVISRPLSLVNPLQGVAAYSLSPLFVSDLCFYTATTPAVNCSFRRAPVLHARRAAMRACLAPTPALRGFLLVEGGSVPSCKARRESAARAFLSGLHRASGEVRKKVWHWVWSAAPRRSGVADCRWPAHSHPLRCSSPQPFSLQVCQQSGGQVQYTCS